MIWVHSALTGSAYYNLIAMWTNDQTTVYSDFFSSGSWAIYLSWTDNSVSWYYNGSDGSRQLDFSGTNYAYIAFG